MEEELCVFYLCFCRAGNRREKGKEEKGDERGRENCFVFCFPLPPCVKSTFFRLSNVRFFCFIPRNTVVLQ